MDKKKIVFIVPAVICERKGQDIADPWYTGNFDETYRDVKEGCEALIQDCLLRI